jgi:hypothetical protein
MLISVPQLGITLLVLACPNWQSTIGLALAALGVLGLHSKKSIFID